MNRRIAASMSGFAMAAGGFAAGTNVGPSAAPHSLSATCERGNAIERNAIHCADESEPAAFAQPADATLRAQLNDAMLALEREGRLAPFTAVPQIDPATIQNLPEAREAADSLDPADLYRQLAAATVMIHTGYKCDRCSNWHGGVATGFIVHPDGWVMTAGHVLRNLEANRHLSVMLHDRSLHPIEGVALIEDEADVAVFRIDAKELPYLPLAEDEPVPGTAVSVLSHPNGHFYVLTRGVVSRVLDASAQPRERLQITAPFAIGSSGAAAVDDSGNAIGLALSTETVYADPQDQKNPQLVIPTCTPAAAIRAAIEKN